MAKMFRCRKLGVWSFDLTFQVTPVLQKNHILFCRGDNVQIIWHFLQLSAPLIMLIKCCDGSTFFLPQKLWLFWNCDMTTALIFFRPGCLNVFVFFHDGWWMLQQNVTCYTCYCWSLYPVNHWNDCVLQGRRWVKHFFPSTDSVTNLSLLTVKH